MEGEGETDRTLAWKGMDGWHGKGREGKGTNTSKRGGFFFSECGFWYSGMTGTNERNASSFFTLFFSGWLFWGLLTVACLCCFASPVQLVVVSCELCAWWL